MSSPIHPVIRRYTDGEISALRAAAELGDSMTVSDLVMMVKAAGLEPPRQPLTQERAELARARRLLGLNPD